MEISCHGYLAGTPRGEAYSKAGVSECSVIYPACRRSWEQTIVYLLVILHILHSLWKRGCRIWFERHNFVKLNFYAWLNGDVVRLALTKSFDERSAWIPMTSPHWVHLFVGGRTHSMTRDSKRNMVDWSPCDWKGPSFAIFLPRIGEIVKRCVLHSTILLIRSVCASGLNGDVDVDANNRAWYEQVGCIAFAIASIFLVCDGPRAPSLLFPCTPFF